MPTHISQSALYLLRTGEPARTGAFPFVSACERLPQGEGEYLLPAYELRAYGEHRLPFIECPACCVLVDDALATGRFEASPWSQNEKVSDRS